MKNFPSQILTEVNQFVLLDFLEEKKQKVETFSQFKEFFSCFGEQNCRLSIHIEFPFDPFFHKNKKVLPLLLKTEIISSDQPIPLFDPPCK